MKKPIKGNIYWTCHTVVRCLCRTVLTLTLSLFSISGNAADSSFGEMLNHDYTHFYSDRNLQSLGAGFFVFGLVANTALDTHTQNWYQRQVRSETSDQIARVAKLFGEHLYLLPVAFSAGLLPSGSDIGKWGDNATRAYLVGGPAMLLMQLTTGASRPDESDSGSSWHPFNDDNGVSGHAFVGAIPFLTVAQQQHASWLRAMSYAASVATAWSRVNDNKHYFSQAALGWLMAYSAVLAVKSSNDDLAAREQTSHSYQLPITSRITIGNSTLRLSPLIGTHSFGISLSMQ